MRKVCARCGADSKEAQITQSHCPHTATFKVCGGKGWRNQQNVYLLCHYCHGIYTELEKRVLREACQKMYSLHAQFIRDAI